MKLECFSITIDIKNLSLTISIILFLLFNTTTYYTAKTKKEKIVSRMLKCLASKTFFFILTFSTV